MKKVVYLINVICLIHFSVNGAIRYVKPSSSGLSDGSSWANASSDLQAMINTSSVGDEVWVAAGVYYPLADGSGNSSPSDARNQSKIDRFKLNPNKCFKRILTNCSLA